MPSPSGSTVACPICDAPLERVTDPEDGVLFWVCSGCSTGWNDSEVEDAA